VSFRFVVNNAQPYRDEEGGGVFKLLLRFFGAWRGSEQLHVSNDVDKIQLN
jgi:hypothetical protein